MITSKQDYLQNLHLIYNQNFPNYAQLDTDEVIYNIDVTSRTIAAPQFLGVAKDHRAETIYFKIPRFVDYVDLASTACIIYYINAKGESGIYIPQFYDIFTYHLDNEMLIPWTLSGHVLKSEGAVQFSIRFFKTLLNVIPGVPTAEPQLVYDLHFLPATSKVLKGINIKDEDQKEYNDKATTQFDEIWMSLKNLNDRQPLKWVIIK